MRFSDVSFAYKTSSESGESGVKVVFENFSLELPDKGVTALAGASGCGKTTLLRLLAGLEKPDSGEISGNPAPQEIAFMFQENRLLPGLTAAQQIQLVLPQGESALDYLAMVGLRDDAASLPRELSGGMQRRVALARALAYARGKKLLLLDEPFAGIDSARVRELMGHIRALGMPVVLTGHGSIVLEIADNVAEVK
jgi:ABC-type nitrate/sulfonate/bicarbonate transport system ATPase subunit